MATLPDDLLMAEPVDFAEPDAVTIVDPYEPSAVQKTLMLARSTGNIADAWDDSGLTQLGADVVRDYELDLKDREPWAEVVRRAQKSAAQEERTTKNYPWDRASNVKYPLLTVAALQFNARAYPAIVKGDEAISIKVVGSDRGRPAMRMTPMGPQPVMEPIAGPDGRMAMGPDGTPQMQPVWLIPPGAKSARAARVKDYLNTTLFYRMENWESDTDALLMTLPIDGCAFRKVWYDKASEQQKAALVSALRIVVPIGAKCVQTTPRLTEEVPDVYPYQISERMLSGFYRTATLVAEGEDDQAPRLFLEQHRLIDVDGDGVMEPYIVTVDRNTSEVLRVEANFSARDVAVNDNGDVLSIARGKFYIKYDFFPHPEGKFYGIGLGHLLDQLGDVINTALNQMIDAGHAQVAGGGFIASGVRLQDSGGRSQVRYRPGEYRTVNGVTGDQLRNAIYERTWPGPSAVMVQILDMMLAAARDISSVKDVITGEASNNGQVGTTLALIEQGLQVFTAIYKRIYRSLREEYALLYENIARFGGERAAQDYSEVLDDPAANFEHDFAFEDMDIRPVSDPTSVTRMQKMARAQFLGGVTAGDPNIDQREVKRRIFEAADIEDADKLFVPPQQPDPLQMAGAQAEIAKTQSEAGRNEAQALKSRADAMRAVFEMGAMDGSADARGVSGMAGGPGNALGSFADAQPFGLAA